MSEGRVVCYYTNWSVYRPGTAKYNPQNINPYLCTHLIYAFGGFTKDNQMKPFDKYQDVEQGGYAKFTGLKTYNKQLKTMIAIGGWNEASTRFSPLVANVERRQKFIKNVLKFLRQNHFDGIDLDWEYPAHREGGKPHDREYYAQFVEELRAEFERESQKTGRPRLLVTMAVPAGIEYIEKGYDIPKLNKYLDWFNVLTYDFHSSHEPSVNHHAPLYSLEEESEYNYDTELNIDYSIKFYLKAGADRDKLVLGIPTYGRSFTLINEESTEIGAPSEGPGEQGDATREKGYLAYYEICQSIKDDPEWTVVQPNANAMGPYAYRRNQWVGYDDEAIVRKKAAYVVDQGLGGIMFWAIDNDDFRGTCTGKPYPLIEAAKEEMLSLLGLGINEVSKPSSPKKPNRSRSRDDSVSAKNPKRTSIERKNTISKDTAIRSRNRNQKPTTTSPSTTTIKLTEVEGSSLYIGSRTTTPAPPTTPDPGADFKCEEEGFFQHPRDCKKYYWCLDSGPSGLGIVGHQFTCPSGLYFNPAADSCDFARNVPCKTKKSATTEAPTTTTTVTPKTTTKTTTTRFTQSFATRRPIISTTTTRKTTTIRTTTPKEEPEYEYEDEEENEEDENPSTIKFKDAEEDPKVIKELIQLIRKVGGIDELEKHILRKEDGTIAFKETDLPNNSPTTPPSISKSLYDKVLSRPNTLSSLRSRFSSSSFLRKQDKELLESNKNKNDKDEVSAAVDNIGSKYSSVVRNARPPPQRVEESKSDEDEEHVKEKKQYVTIARNRTRYASDSDEDAENSQNDNIDNEKIIEKHISTESTSPKYANIRRTRPTIKTQNSEDQDSQSQTKPKESSEGRYLTLNRARGRTSTNIPNYSTILRSQTSSSTTENSNIHENENESIDIEDIDDDEEDNEQQINVREQSRTNENTQTTQTISTRNYDNISRRFTKPTESSTPIIETSQHETETIASIMNITETESTTPYIKISSQDTTSIPNITVYDHTESITTTSAITNTSDLIASNNEYFIPMVNSFSGNSTNHLQNDSNINNNFNEKTEDVIEYPTVTTTETLTTTNIDETIDEVKHFLINKQNISTTSTTSTFTTNEKLHNLETASNKLVKNNNTKNESSSQRKKTNNTSGENIKNIPNQLFKIQSQQTTLATRNNVTTTTPPNKIHGTASSPRPFGFPKRRFKPTRYNTTAPVNEEPNSEKKIGELKISAVNNSVSKVSSELDYKNSNVFDKQHNDSTSTHINEILDQNTSSADKQIVTSSRNLSSLYALTVDNNENVADENSILTRSYSWRDPRRPTKPSKIKYNKSKAKSEYLDITQEYQRQISRNELKTSTDTNNIQESKYRSNDTKTNIVSRRNQNRILIDYQLNDTLDSTENRTLDNNEKSRKQNYSKTSRYSIITNNLSEASNSKKSENSVNNTKQRITSSRTQKGIVMDSKLVNERLNDNTKDHKDESVTQNNPTLDTEQKYHNHNTNVKKNTFSSQIQKINEYELLYNATEKIEILPKNNINIKLTNITSQNGIKNLTFDDITEKNDNLQIKNFTNETDNNYEFNITSKTPDKDFKLQSRELVVPTTPTPDIKSSTENQLQQKERSLNPTRQVRRRVVNRIITTMPPEQNTYDKQSIDEERIESIDKTQRISRSRGSVRFRDSDLSSLLSFDFAPKSKQKSDVSNVQKNTRRILTKDVRDSQSDTISDIKTRPHTQKSRVTSKQDDINVTIASPLAINATTIIPPIRRSNNINKKLVTPSLETRKINRNYTIFRRPIVKMLDESESNLKTSDSKTEIIAENYNSENISFPILNQTKSLSLQTTFRRPLEKISSEKNTDIIYLESNNTTKSQKNTTVLGQSESSKKYTTSRQPIHNIVSPSNELTTENWNRTDIEQTTESLKSEEDKKIDLNITEVKSDKIDMEQESSLVNLSTINHNENLNFLKQQFVDALQKFNNSELNTTKANLGVQNETNLESKETNNFDSKSLTVPIYHRRRYFKYITDSPITYVDKNEQLLEKNKPEILSRDIERNILTVFNLGETVQKEASNFNSSRKMAKKRNHSDLLQNESQINTVNRSSIRIGKSYNVQSEDKLFDKNQTFKPAYASTPTIKLKILSQENSNHVNRSFNHILTNFTTEDLNKTTSGEKIHEIDYFEFLQKNGSEDSLQLNENLESSYDTVNLTFNSTIDAQSLNDDLQKTKIDVISNSSSLLNLATTRPINKSLKKKLISRRLVSEKQLLAHNNETNNFSSLANQSNIEIDNTNLNKLGNIYSSKNLANITTNNITNQQSQIITNSLQNQEKKINRNFLKLPSNNIEKDNGAGKKIYKSNVTQSRTYKDDKVIEYISNSTRSLQNNTELALEEVKDLTTNKQSPPISEYKPRNFQPTNRSNLFPNRKMQTIEEKNKSENSTLESVEITTESEQKLHKSPIKFSTRSRQKLITNTKGNYANPELRENDNDKLIKNGKSISTTNESNDNQFKEEEDEFAGLGLNSSNKTNFTRSYLNRARTNPKLDINKNKYENLNGAEENSEKNVKGEKVNSNRRFQKNQFSRPRYSTTARPILIQKEELSSKKYQVNKFSKDEEDEDDETLETTLSTSTTPVPRRRKTFKLRRPIGDGHVNKFNRVDNSTTSDVSYTNLNATETNDTNDQKPFNINTNETNSNTTPNKRIRKIIRKIFKPSNQTLVESNSDNSTKAKISTSSPGTRYKGISASTDKLGVSNSNTLENNVNNKTLARSKLFGKSIKNFTTNNISELQEVPTTTTPDIILEKTDADIKSNNSSSFKRLHKKLIARRPYTAGKVNITSAPTQKYVREKLNEKDDEDEGEDEHYNKAIDEVQHDNETLTVSVRSTTPKYLRVRPLVVYTPKTKTVSTNREYDDAFDESDDKNKNETIDVSNETTTAKNLRSRPLEVYTPKTFSEKTNLEDAEDINKINDNVEVQKEDNNNNETIVVSVNPLTPNYLRPRPFVVSTTKIPSIGNAHVSEDVNKNKNNDEINEEGKNTSYTSIRPSTSKYFRPRPLVVSTRKIQTDSANTEKSEAVKENESYDEVNAENKNTSENSSASIEPSIPKFFRARPIIVSTQKIPTDNANVEENENVDENKNYDEPNEDDKNKEILPASVKPTTSKYFRSRPFVLSSTPQTSTINTRSDVNEDLEDDSEDDYENEDYEENTEVQNSEIEIEEKTNETIPVTHSTLPKKENRVLPGARPILQKATTSPKFISNSQTKKPFEALNANRFRATKRIQTRKRIVNRPFGVTDRTDKLDYLHTTATNKPAAFVPTNTRTYERKYAVTTSEASEINNDVPTLLEDLNIEALNARNKKIFDLNSKKHTNLKPKIQTQLMKPLSDAQQYNTTLHNTEHENDDEYHNNTTTTPKVQSATVISTQTTLANNANANEFSSQANDDLTQTTQQTPTTTLLHIFTLFDELSTSPKPNLSDNSQTVKQLVTEELKHKVVEINRIVEITSKEDKLRRTSKNNKQILEPIGTSSLKVVSLPHLEQLGEISVVKFVHLVNSSDIEIDGHSTVADYTPTEPSFIKGSEPVRNSLPEAYQQQPIYAAALQATESSKAYKELTERYGKALIPEVLREAVETSTISLEGLFDNARKAKNLNYDSDMSKTTTQNIDSITESVKPVELHQTIVYTNKNVTLGIEKSTNNNNQITTSRPSKYVRPLVPLLRTESNESSPIVISIANLDKVILSKVNSTYSEVDTSTTTETISETEAITTSTFDNTDLS